MASALELDAMRRAIVLSAFGLGTMSPNPPVGCVILDVNGQLVGEGYHERKGEPHAEAQALTAAGERARGGSAIVTLEPYNHHGRTPPCRQALIKAGIARVVISVIDPTSRGRGGAAELQSAGLAVEVGVIDDETRLVLGPWLAALEHKRPFVTLVYTVDESGRISGSPLAGEVAMNAYDLRLIHDAVLLDDGRLEEGRPGVRSLLLDHDCTLAGELLEAGWVDQTVAYVESGGPASARDTTVDAAYFAGLVTGFALRDVT